MEFSHGKNQFNNYAFIDAQNLNLGVRKLGWRLDFKRFRVYLKDKYKITKAYLFIGYLPENQNLYRALQEYGYLLIFKPVLKKGDGTVKGNVDAELVLQAVIEYPYYENAVIVTSDGDFSCLVDYLYRQEKLETVISPCYETCSVLLRRAAQEKIIFIDTLHQKLSYNKKEHRLRTKPLRSALSS